MRARPHKTCAARLPVSALWRPAAGRAATPGTMLSARAPALAGTVRPAAPHSGLYMEPGRTACRLGQTLNQLEAQCLACSARQVFEPRRAICFMLSFTSIILISLQQSMKLILVERARVLTYAPALAGPILSRSGTFSGHNAAATRTPNMACGWWVSPTAHISRKANPWLRKTRGASAP